MAQLTTQTIEQAGLVPSLQAASSGGDTWEPTSTTFLMVKNADSASHTVTIVTTAEAFGQPVADIAVAVAAGTTVLFGPYDPGEVGQPSTGLASITYSAVTSVTIAAVQL